MPAKQTATEWLDRHVKRGEPDACWEAHGKGFNQRGWHVTFKAESRRWLAHRAAWEKEHGPIPQGMNVLHKCDNPRCCNPRHLFLGTQADNVRDMWAKGRAGPRVGPQGRKFGRSTTRTLDDREVRDVFSRYLHGSTQRQIAEAYGVTDAAISALLRGVTYEEFTEERASVAHLLGRNRRAANGHRHA